MPEQTPKPEPPLAPPRNPKERFQRTAHRRAHELWTDTAAAQAAIEAALAEYVDRLDVQGDSLAAIQSYASLMGAKTVLQILANLHLPEQMQKPEAWPKLKPPK